MIVNCQRCEVRCQITEAGNPKAKMLRRSQKPGLCVNCAVHDFLRNTYPCNMLLAQSGPKHLGHPHIQEQFAEIMRVGMSDAVPDEISWELIIENWDLAFPHDVKPSATNPCSHLELFEIAEGTRPGLGDVPVNRHTITNYEDLTIRSFEQLNEAEPGLGDDLRNCLRSE